MNIALLIIFLIVGLFHVNYAIFKIPNGADESSSFKAFNDNRANMQLHTVKIFSRETTKTLSGYSCSGSIIHELFVITSAHCVAGFNIIDVFIGNVTNETNDLDHIVRVIKVFIHQYFDYENEITNDIALLKLRRSLNTLNNSFEIISLPSRQDVKTNYTGLRGITSGYGKYGDSGPTAIAPNYAYYEIIPLKECQNLFFHNYTEYASTSLCGKGIGASSCQGDSGQGLTIFRHGKKKLVGIVSKGLESCETLNEPEVFVRVDSYLDFIEEVIKNN